MGQTAVATEVPVMTRGALIPLLGLLLLEALVLMIPGHLAITGHEVDVLHATSAVMRIVDGELAHLDFLTPLGPMSFYPVAWFVEAGLGIGRAWLAANLAVAAVLLPAILYVARTRMPGALGLVFGAFLIILATAVVYGGDQATVSISMAYNRWGWAVVFVLLALLILPQKDGDGRFDGLIIGVGLGYLALLKMTFFVVLLPVVVVGLAGRWRTLAETAFAGLAVAGVATLLFGGMAFWGAYARDLLTVAGSDVRPFPGLELQSLFAAPAYMPGTVCLLALVVALRLGGASKAGLLLLIAMPGLVYATYQNWGNDPKWLVLVGVLALAFAPRVTGALPGGLPVRQGLWLIAAAAFAIIAPSVMNLAISPLRNAMASADGYVSFLADGDAGLWIERARSYDGEATTLLPPLPDPLADAETPAEDPIRLGDTVIEQCTQKSAYYGKIRAIADRLEATGYANEPLLYVDVTNPLPLVAGFRRLAGEAPWYYGGTSALDGAAFLVVPKCGSSNTTFRAYVAALNEVGVGPLVAEETHYFLFRAR